MLCIVHQIEVDKTDKAGKDYHWVQGKEGTMCYGAYSFNFKTKETVQYGTDPLPRPVSLPPKVQKEVSDFEKELGEVAKKQVEQVEQVEIEYKPETREEKMWRAKEEREKITFERKQQRDLRKDLAVVRLRDAYVTQGGTISDEEMDRTFHWVWTGDWK